MSELISVIIPVYNVEQYLKRCLSSVIQQTYPAIEILLIDDGSTDQTLKIARCFQEKYPDKIRVFHIKNSGVTIARLKGVKEAKGNWIGFVDGDDEIELDMYERLYTNAKKYDADISHCGYQTIVNNGERVHYFYNTGNLSVQVGKAGLNDLLVGPVEPSLWNKLFRKELLDKLLDEGIMDTTIKYNEDLLMNFYLFRLAGKAIYEDFCGYHYLAHKSSATRSTFRVEKLVDPVKVWRIILDNVEPELKNSIWQKYLGACIRACAGLYEHDRYREEALSYRQLLFKHRGKYNLLSRNEKIKTIILLFTPSVYKHIHRVYEKYFQKKIYE